LPCYAINDIVPVIEQGAFVHPLAVVIGDVLISTGCYVGPGACLRGDFGRIVLLAGANVQDTCVLHGFPGKNTVVEENGHIGHGAVLHGCVVQRNAMIGMNAVVMDEAVIGEGAIVAACAFGPAGMHIPARSLAVGTPAAVQDPPGRLKDTGGPAKKDRITHKLELTAQADLETARSWLSRAYGRDGA